MDNVTIISKRLFFILAFLLLQTSLNLQSYFHEVISAKSLSEVEETINRHADHALILVDLDNTLIMPEDCVLRDANIEEQKNFIESIYIQPDSSYLMESLLANMNWRLLETGWHDLLNYCKKRAYGVYGFTARNVGKLEWQLFANPTIFERPFVAQDTHEDYTIRSLHKLNIYFNQPNINWFRFKQGVIFCDSLTKGEVLKQFLKMIDASFNAIIFIDDRDYNIDTVSQAVKE